MYKRTLFKTLLAWSKKPNRKPLILRGARQVGKTSLVDMFGVQYTNYIKLNLEIKADRDLFEQDYDISQLVAAIYFQRNLPMQPDENTLLFIDEIQACPKAAAYLRYFYEQRPELAVIVAGSLLETLLDRHITFPVGRVEYLFMQPFSFKEYLLAQGELEAYQMLKQVPCHKFSHQRMLRLFHQYALVGGMPEAIKTFLTNQNIIDNNAVYENLMHGYMNDVEKYAPNKTMVHVIRHAIAHAPIASGERIHFHGFGQSNYKSREMGEALRTLEKAMLLKLIYPTVATNPPAEIDIRKSPRLLFLDVGLTNYIAGIQQYYFKVTDLNAIFLGKLLESLVGQELLTIYPEQINPLKFWVREKSQSQAEVDFVIPLQKYLVPIEVKAGATGRLKSLMQYMDSAKHNKAVRLYAGDINYSKVITPKGKSFFLINLPYYLASQVYQYL